MKNSKLEKLAEYFRSRLLYFEEIGGVEDDGRYFPFRRKEWSI